MVHLQFLIILTQLWHAHPHRHIGWSRVKILFSPQCSQHNTQALSMRIRGVCARMWPHWSRSLGWKRVFVCLWVRDRGPLVFIWQRDQIWRHVPEPERFPASLLSCPAACTGYSISQQPPGSTGQKEENDCVLNPLNNAALLFLAYKIRHSLFLVWAV